MINKDTLGIGDWGLGIGGLGFGGGGQNPRPNPPTPHTHHPLSPIPNPHKINKFKIITILK